MVAKGGDRLLERRCGRRRMRLELLPRAHIVTPNMPEAEAWPGCRSRRSTTCGRPASGSSSSGPRVVLVKGGHLDGPGDRRRGDAARHVRAARPADRRRVIPTAPAARCRRRSPRTSRSGMDDRTALTRAREYLDGAHPPCARPRARPRAARSFLAVILKGGVEPAVAPVSGHRRFAGRRPRVAASVAGPATGAVATFVGLVRDHNAGRRVLWLDYEAFAPLAVKAFERIADRSAAQWPSVDLAIHHRTGRLGIGDASVVIARRLAASRRGLQRLPLRDRAGETDRADLEARALRGRRGLDRRRDRRSRGRGGAAGRDGAGMLVTIRLFARLRELAGASELQHELPEGASARTAWERLVRESPALERLRPRRVVRRQRGVRPADDAVEARRRGRLPAAGVRRVTGSDERVTRYSGAIC